MSERVSQIKRVELSDHLPNKTEVTFKEVESDVEFLNEFSIDDIKRVADTFCLDHNTSEQTVAMELFVSENGGKDLRSDFVYTVAKYIYNLREYFSKHTPDTIVVDDAGGRLLGHLLRHTLTESEILDGKTPNFQYVYAGQKLSESSTYNAVKSHIDLQVRAGRIGSETLIVTEYIRGGTAMSLLSDILDAEGISHTFAPLSVHEDFATNVHTRESYKTIADTPFANRTIIGRASTIGADILWGKAGQFSGTTQPIEDTPVVAVYTPDGYETTESHAEKKAAIREAFTYLARELAPLLVEPHK